jgi:AcrR family transcriptional regulator
MQGTVHQLPRGRHGLTREEVVGSQRERILSAMARAVGSKGFARATVADVIALAGVSRETFYEQFSDKEDCFLATLEQAADALLGAIAISTPMVASDPVEVLDGVLAVYLDLLRAEPAAAKAFLIDAYGAGPVVTARRVELQQRFVDAVATIFGVASAPPASAERFACEALVAAISSMVTVRLGSGRIDELPALREPLVALVRKGMAV